jgi:hypothetical protein
LGPLPYTPSPQVRGGWWHSEFNRFHYDVELVLKEEGDELLRPSWITNGGREEEAGGAEGGVRAAHAAAECCSGKLPHGAAAVSCSKVSVLSCLTTWLPSPRGRPRAGASVRWPEFAEVPNGLAAISKGVGRELGSDHCLQDLLRDLAGPSLGTEASTGDFGFSKGPSAGWGLTIAFMTFCETSQDQSWARRLPRGGFGWLCARALLARALPAGKDAGCRPGGLQWILFARFLETGLPADVFAFRGAGALAFREQRGH